MSKRVNAKTRISERERLWEEQEHKCIYCDRELTKDEASLEHVIPIVLGGEDVEENRVCSCKRCNRNKQDYIIFYHLEDKCYYPIVDVPYFFLVREIQANGYKDNNLQRLIKKREKENDLSNVRSS